METLVLEIPHDDLLVSGTADEVAIVEHELEPCDKVLMPAECLLQGAGGHRPDQDVLEASSDLRS